MTEPFPLSPKDMFREGIVGFRRQPLLLLAGGAMTFAVFAVFRVPAQMAMNDERTVASVALDLVGSVLAATAAYPWFSYALGAARDKPISFMKPFRNPGRFYAQFVAAIWFWAAVMLGLRYLLGIPALLAAVFYAFYGYLVVDRSDMGGLKVLGTSVRLGDKRRVALFAILALFAMFNFLAAIPLGYGVNIGTIAATIGLLLITTSVTLVSGAALYDVLRKDLADG